MITGIQQIQLRNCFKNEASALEALRAVKEAGLDGIELNGFMIRRLSLPIKMLLWAAKMPVGNSDRLDWKKLVNESELSVISLHEDLRRILTQTEQVVSDAKEFNTNKIVISGMRNFDYTDETELENLCKQFDKAGKLLKEQGLKLLIHNHNCEFQRLKSGQTAFEYIVSHTNPDLVSFEIDIYWANDAGVDTEFLLKNLGSRLSMLHVSDRGIRPVGKAGSILKADFLELGEGNLPLNDIIKGAQTNGVEAIVIETNGNWIHQSAIESMKISSQYLKQII